MEKWCGFGLQRHLCNWVRQAGGFAVYRSEGIRPQCVSSVERSVERPLRRVCAACQCTLDIDWRQRRRPIRLPEGARIAHPELRASQTMNLSNHHHTKSMTGGPRRALRHKAIGSRCVKKGSARMPRAIASPRAEVARDAELPPEIEEALWFIVRHRRDSLLLDCDPSRTSLRRPCASSICRGLRQHVFAELCISHWRR